MTNYSGKKTLAYIRKFFQSNEYHTPQDMPRAIVDRLGLGSGTYLYTKYVGLILQGWVDVQRDQYDRAAYANTSFNVFRGIERSNGRFHITGLNYVHKLQKPVVFISNHMSTLENNVFPCLIAPYVPVTFVVKASLMRYPFFGKMIASRKPIALGRVNPREDLKKVMEQGCERLLSGTSVVVYPQGTRTLSFDPSTFNSLGTRLAKKAGVRVIPVAVKTDFWRNGRILRDFGPIDRKQPIHIEFGAPVVVTENSKEAHHQIVEFICSRLNKWQGLNQDCGTAVS
jgi:1-acyl-sn-glycerol-3-phosphate acyltransferase